MPNKKSQLGGGKDPSGSVYEQDGSIFRSISPEFISFFRSVLEKNTIQRMIGSELVATSLKSEKNDDENLLLMHAKISPINYPYEWSSAMLHDAARLTLEISQNLLDEGLILKDATPWNVMFDSGKPVFLDFTSIMPLDSDLVWVALDQFNRLFLFPLLMAGQGYGRVVRSLMLATQNGISSNEIISFLKPFDWVKKPWLIKRIYLPLMIVSMLQKSGQDKEIGKYIKKVKISTDTRKKFFNELLADLNSIKFKIGERRWSKYYSDMETFFTPEQFNQNSWLYLI